MLHLFAGAAMLQGKGSLVAFIVEKFRISWI